MPVRVEDRGWNLSAALQSITLRAQSALNLFCWGSRWKALGLLWGGAMVLPAILRGVMAI